MNFMAQIFNIQIYKVTFIVRSKVGKDPRIYQNVKGLIVFR